MIKRVYVAGSSKDMDNVRRVMTVAENYGLSVTCDWVTDVQTSGVSAPEDKGEAAFFSDKDMDAIRCADALVFVVSEHASRGAHFELGAAYYAGKPCLIVGDEASDRIKCLFYAKFPWYATPEDAFVRLTRWE